MALKSDITIAAEKFQPSAISEETTRLKQHLIEIFAGAPNWYEVGAAKYREMRVTGATPLPAPNVLESALTIELPSRDDGRTIPCRLVYPTARKTTEERKSCKGSVLHIHGGGWVLGDYQSADLLLQHYADAGDLAVLSVGYRLAPEDPFPKGPEDCIDLGEFLARNSERDYGGPLRFIGGESAGGHLSILVAFHLLKSIPSFHLLGLLLHFGTYDLSLLPAARNYNKPLILNRVLMEKFTEAFVPGMSSDEIKHPSVSPYYEDLEPFRGQLPSALFTCGTDDPLLDDSVNMGTKWMMFGGDAIVKIYPGCPHTFIRFPANILGEAGKALMDTKTYIQACMARS